MTYSDGACSDGPDPPQTSSKSSIVDAGGAAQRDGGD